MHQEDCRYLYKKLLYTLDKPMNNDNTEYYLRNFKETEHCDHVYNFEKIRRDLNTYIDQHEDLKIDIAEPQKSSEINKQAIFHYYTWHKYNLVKSLSWYDYFHYRYSQFKKEYYKYKRYI